jgi:hypothetical protein
MLAIENMDTLITDIENFIDLQNSISVAVENNTQSN